MDSLLKSGLRGAVVIPARGGSKGIPRKNLLDFDGSKLVELPIAAARNAKTISNAAIYVSTDDAEIAAVACAAGAMVIERPHGISGDLATDYECMRHFLTVVAGFDFIVHLRSTYPTITGDIVDDAVTKFVESYRAYDSLRSVVRAAQSPYKMWKLVSNRLVPVIVGNSLHSSPRQIIPNSYIQNAAIDIVKVDTIVLKCSMVGDIVMPYVMSESDGIDIDTLDELNELRSKVSKNE